MKGYNGKMLWVNLSEKSSREEVIPNDWYTKYIGGEGFVAKILYDKLEAKIDPLGTKNLLIFASGPLNGTLAPCSGRTCVGFKSPLTGTIGLSNVGGQLAPVLKKTGFDVIIFEGKSDTPVYTYIKDSKVEFKDASHLWGLDTEVTENKIREELGNEKVRIAEIGPAGENIVLYASIMIDSHRAAGRGGSGAVMGSKNLKAMVVDGSGKRTEITDMEKFNVFSKQARQEIKDEHFVNELLAPFGTPSFADSMNAIGCLPTRNWQSTTFDKIIDIGYETYHKKLKVKAAPCHACPIGCGRDTEIMEGKYKGQKGYGPEFEGIGAFGSKTAVSDINEIAMAYYLCNRYGLDIISAGQTIATAMEWYEKGLINKETTNGIELEFGNGESMIKMVEKIANRDGFGDVLAEGSLRASKIIGGDAYKYVFHVKGLELAACGVRASKGQVLSHIGSERGGDHLRPYASTIDAFGYINKELKIHEQKSPTQDSDKHWVKPLKEVNMITNLLGTCLFTTITLAVQGSTWTGLYNSVTGENLSLEEMFKCSERVINLERMFNIREGFGREHDTLPERLKNEPAPDGVGKGHVVDEKVILDEYYASMGWHIESGIPTDDKLKELGLL